MKFIGYHELHWTDYTSILKVPPMMDDLAFHKRFRMDSTGHNLDTLFLSTTNLYFPFMGVERHGLQKWPPINFNKFSPT